MEASQQQVIDEGETPQSVEQSLLRLEKKIQEVPERSVEENIISLGLNVRSAWNEVYNHYLFQGRTLALPQAQKLHISIQIALKALHIMEAQTDNEKLFAIVKDIITARLRFITILIEEGADAVHKAIQEQRGQLLQ